MTRPRLGKLLGPFGDEGADGGLCHRFVYVLPELLLRPPLGVGILLPTLDPEVPDLVAAGPLPAVDTQTHRARGTNVSQGAKPR